MADAVVSTKYGKRPVLDVPPMKAYGGNLQLNNQVSSMMDYNTSSLIQQPQPLQQPVQYLTPPPQTQYIAALQQQQQQQQQPQPVTQQVQYPTIQQQMPPQQPYQQPSAYNPFAGGFGDQRMVASAPTLPTLDPNSFMAAMMGSMNPFNPSNMLGPPLAPPPVPPIPQPPPNYPPPVYDRNYNQPNYSTPPPPPGPHHYPLMNHPVHASMDDNYSIQGKLEYGKMTTVHVDSITGNFRQLPEILRKELKRTYGKYSETDIKISVENGEYHIYASPHRDDDRPIRGPRVYDEEEKKYDHDDYKRQPRFNEEFRPKPPREYDADFIRGRGFEQEPRRRTDIQDNFRGRDSRMTDADWVLVKRR